MMFLLSCGTYVFVMDDGYSYSSLIDLHLRIHLPILPVQDDLAEWVLNNLNCLGLQGDYKLDLNCLHILELQDDCYALVDALLDHIIAILVPHLRTM